jgi:hypothetical protein
MSLFDTAQAWFFYRSKKGKFSWIGDIFFGAILLIPTIFFRILKRKK